MNGDPGWPLSWRSVAGILIPGVGQSTAYEAVAEGSRLFRSRLLFMALSGALVSLSFVVFVLATSGGLNRTDRDPLLDQWVVVSALLALVGSAMLTTSRRVGKLDCSSIDSLGQSWSTRLILRLALCEWTALLGFGGFLLTFTVWPWVVGLTTAAIGFALVAPTARQVQADQEQLAEQGCAYSLLDTLHPSTAGEAA